MYSMLSDDGKESNTAKGVNIATDFMNLETLYLIKKYSNTKWKEFKVKNTNLEHMESTKHYRVLMVKYLF